MDLHECLPQLLPCRQQWPHDLAEIRYAIDKLANAIVEPDRANDTDLEPKIAQQATNVILDGDCLLLKQLAGGQKGAVLLARQRLYMNRPEQIDTHHLRDAARIVAVSLVHLGLEESLRMSGFYADRRPRCFLAGFMLVEMRR